MFLNDNIWLGTAFALSLLATIFGLLFVLAWLEPGRHTQATRRPTRPILGGTNDSGVRPVGEVLASARQLSSRGASQIVVKNVVLSAQQRSASQSS